jgi:hypothetical protein
MSMVVRSEENGPRIAPASEIMGGPDQFGKMKSSMLQDLEEIWNRLH